MSEAKNNQKVTPDLSQDLQNDLEFYATEINQLFTSIDNSKVMIYIQKVFNKAIEEIHLLEFFKIENNQSSSDEPINPITENEQTLQKILTIQQFQEIVEFSLKESDQKNEDKYNREYGFIQDDLDDEDMQAINEKLKDLAEGLDEISLENVINRITWNFQKQQIAIINTQQVNLTVNQIISFNIFLKLQIQLKDQFHLLDQLKKPVDLTSVFSKLDQPFPEPALQIVDPNQIELAPEVLDPNQIELAPEVLDPYQFEKNFEEDFMKDNGLQAISKYKNYLQNYDYFRKVDIKKLIQTKYPEASRQSIPIIKDVLHELGKLLDEKDPNKSNQQIQNDLSPFFVSIYEQSAQNQSFQIYQLMVFLIQNILPSVIIQEPLSLIQQQKQEFDQLTQLLPNMNKKYSIKEYSSLDQFSNFDNQIRKLQDYFRVNRKLDGNLLIQILFDFIKRRVNFKDLLQELKHSDSQLKELLCITCAYFIPLPFLSYNPWLKNHQSMQLKMIGELQYILEKSKAILQFKLQSNKSQFMLQKDPSGCTMLINQLFGREFSLHEHNLINFGAVEIQMDLNCADVEHLVVADTHGFIDIQILEQIFPIFDGFIVHVTENQQKNFEIQQIMNKMFQVISNNSNQKKTILIIKHHESAILDFTAEKIDKDYCKNLEIFQINTQNIQKLSDNNKSNLISSIQKVLESFYKIDVEIYKNNPSIRLQTKQIFLDILKQVNKDVSNEYQAVHNRLCQIIGVIENQQNLKGIDFLPMLYYKNKETQLKELINNENTPQKIKNQSNQDLEQIKKSMKNQLSTQIINLYSEIINLNDCMKLLPSLSSIIKGFLESKLKELIKERDDKREQLLIANSNEIKISLEYQLKDINQAIDQKWFSTELLNRELYYLGQNSKASFITKHNYFQLVRHFECTAQPFELVDGDTLNFTSDVYQDVFSNYDHEDLLIVCVLGPQSSGKSLLMNYLFGTSFLSSSGRCTKGVYASVLNFKAIDGSNKKILILDTEGIQSSEARDSTFDKRIVYYAICVSHVVLMCNKGEMNAPMSETIKLVADAIINTQMPFLKNPTIYIVLNMLANPNDKTVTDCIDGVQKELKQLPQFLKNNNQDSFNKNQQLVNQVLKIDKESIVPLGFAFNTFQFGLNGNRTVNKPSPEFAMRTMNLREKIFNKFIEIENSKSTKYSLTDWFRHAQDFWAFSRDCKSLKDYETLSQKRIDDELLQKIEELIKLNYGEEIWQNTIKIEIDKELDEIFKINQGGSSIKFQNIYGQIQNKIEERYNEIQNKVLDLYKLFCQEKQVGIDLMKKREEILNRKKEQYMKETERYCRQMLSKFIEQKSKVVGDTILQEEIIRLLKEKDEYTQEEANVQFKISWQKSIEQILNVIMKGEELTKRSIKSVKDEFKHAINQTPKYDQDYFEMAKNNPSQYWYPIIKANYYKDALMFIGDQNLPKTKLILEAQNKKNKKYVDNQKMQIFENKTIYHYFNWWNALFSILNTYELIKQLASKIFSEKDVGAQFDIWNDVKTVKKDFERNVKRVIDQFKQECNKLGFSFKPEADVFIQIVKQFNLKDTEANQKVFQSDCRKIFDKKNNFACEQLINPFKNFNKFGNFKPSIKELCRELNLQFFIIFTNMQEYYDINKFKEESEIERLQQDGFLFDREFRIDISSKIKEILSGAQIIQQSFKIPAFFDQYLDYLLDPHSNKPQNKANQAAQQYFFNAIQWEIVFKDLEITVIKNFKVNGEIEQNKTIQQYVEILSKNDYESEKLAQDFNKMSAKLARGISRDVNDIIKIIDEELEAFCMKISDTGKVFILLVIQIYAYLLTEQLEIVSESQPLSQFKIRKINEKNLFIAKLTQNDSKMDKSWAMKFAEELCDYFYKESKLRVVREFQNKMEGRKDEFRKDQFIRDLEQECEMLYDQQELDQNYFPDDQQEQSKRELVDYYFEPNKLLSEKFKKKFTEVSKEFLESCKETFAKIYSSKIKKLRDYFIRILENLKKSKTNQSSGSLFFPQVSCEEELQKHIDNKTINLSQLQKKAASTYLKYLVGNLWNSDSKLNVEGWDFRIYDDLPLPFASEIINTLNQRFDPEFHDYMAFVLEKGYEITLMHKFIEAVINFLNKNLHIESYVEQQNLEPQEIQEADAEAFSESFQSDQADELDISKISGIHGEGEEIDPDDEQMLNDLKFKTPCKKLKAQEIQIIKDEELVGEYYQDFRTKFLGCQEVCSLCKKQCDEVHDENQQLNANLVHDCKGSHYFQGFGGNKNYQTDLAITHSCNDLKDQDYVVYKGQSISWVEFKSTKLRNWNFNKDPEKLEIAKKSQIKLWNLLGQDICNRYQDQYGLNIVFERAKDLARNVHYILMFDQSDSMEVQSWDELIIAFSSFLQNLASNRGSKENSRLSLIKYNQEASLCFQEEVPEIALVNKVKHEGGDTDFENPLEMAYNLCENTHQKYEKLILYFMTDGEADHPKKAIDKFKKKTDFTKKLQFLIVGFGQDINIESLEEIGKAMPNGKVQEALSVEELTESFKMIVINDHAA